MKKFVFCLFFASFAIAAGAQSYQQDRENREMLSFPLVLSCPNKSLDAVITPKF